MFSQLINISNYYLNPYALPVALGSTLIFAIGFFVLSQNRRSLINIAFFLQCFSVGLWLFTISIVYLNRIPSLAIFYYRHFTFLGVVSIMPSVYLFSVVWTDKLQKRRVIVFTNYILSFLFYMLAITTDKFIATSQIRKYFWGFYPIYQPAVAVFLMFFSLQFFLGIRELLISFKLEKSPIRKIQIKMISVATFIAFIASTDFIPKFFNVAIYPFGYIFMLSYIILVAYSIVRYKTFNIETAIHKTIMWILTSSFIVIPLFLFYKWFFSFMEGSSALQIIFWGVVFLILAFYLRVIQPRIDHFFQRRRANLEEISTKFTEDLVHLKGINQLIVRIEDTIADALYPQHIDIFIYNEANRVYKLANTISNSHQIEQLNIDDALSSWIARNSTTVYSEFVDLDPHFNAVSEKLKSYLALTDAIVVIPLVLNEKLLGIINLGKKSNFKRYTAADFHFLTVLKNQSTIAISNSLVYENIEEQVKQRTKELVKVQQQLIQAEKLATVGTLAGGVAHEINNPLTAILTNVQMLLASGTVDDNMDKESLELIEEATKRCRTIVQKLMTYAKKPLETTEISEVNLLKAVGNVISFLGYQLEQENIKVIIDAKDDKYFVMGNQNELEQVVTNIILNARDAIRQIKNGGQIQVSLMGSGNWILMKIRDDGPGIPKETIPKIFDPFFTTKDVGKGVGLGLSICQSILEKQNGTITVESQINRGCVFTVQLPKITK